MTLGTNKYVHETSCTGPWVHNKSRYSRTTQVSSQLTFAALTPLYKSTSEINKVQYSESHIYIFPLADQELCSGLHHCVWDLLVY